MNCSTNIAQKSELFSKNDLVKLLSLKLKPKITYRGGKRGWVGDNPFIFLDTKKIRSSGWRPKFTIKKSIEITIKYLLKNSWLLKRN